MQGLREGMWCSVISGNCKSVELKLSGSAPAGTLTMDVGGQITNSWQATRIGDIDAASIPGDITIGGPTGGTLSATGTITGDIVISNFTGNICASNLQGLTLETELPANIDLGPACGSWTVCGVDLECDSDGEGLGEDYADR